MFFKTTVISNALIVLSRAAPKGHSRTELVGIAAELSAARNPYIVGGEIVQGREFPAQISLWVDGQFDCGGSILNNEWFLTAAHCSTYKPSDITVFSGSNLLNCGGTKHQVVEIHYHENYRPINSWINDIGVMKVSPPFVFGEGVESINLPQKGLVTPGGTVATVVGWGKTSITGPTPNELRKVDIMVDDHQNCSSEWESNGMLIHDTQICAAGGGGKDVCNGDSGGPLLVNNEIVGIISWGRPCALKGFPTVFTQVSDYIDWIQEHIKS